MKRKNLKILEAEDIVCYDVDNTLVTLKPPDSIYGVSIKSPYDGRIRKYKVHENHVHLLRAHSSRGMHIRVHSANGYRWASTVVKALGLGDFVDSIETKPRTLVDDLPVTEIFPVRIYLNE